MNPENSVNTGLTFESVAVRSVAVPLRRPIVAKVGTYTEWPLILIDVKTREGIVGSAYLEPYVRSAMNYLGAAMSEIGERLKNKPLAPIDCFRESMGLLHLIGREGVSLIATAGLDMAIWDALAKARNLPLAVLLGGSTGKVRAYNSNGLWLIPQEKLAGEAEALIAERGFKALKMRLGRPALKDDIAAVAAVRRAVGDDVHIMSDFNQGYALGEALLRLHGLDDQGLYWFEEPIAYNDIAGNAQLTRELKTPLQIGENIYGPRSFLQFVNAEAADLYMPDLMRIGGVTGWMRAAAIAGAAGKPLSSHLYPEVSAHLLRVSESADWLEWRDWADPILARPFEVQDGHIIVPGTPGNGISWNEEAVRRFAV